MALLHIPLNQIDEARLKALIAAGAAESRTIDYKRTSYGYTDADYSEFLGDISSFANTSGGDLVLGMRAEKGIPKDFMPLTVSMDDEKLRLGQVARDGLQPRIANIDFHAVPIRDGGGGNVLIIRVPRSYNPPHRIIRQGKGSKRFWARTAAGKYEPDVNELRTLFNAVPLLADRIRNFRLDRIATIAADQAPVQLMHRGRLILHIVPFSAFDVISALPLRAIEANNRSFVPIQSTTANSARINFDGILKTSNADPRATLHSAYVQLYRNGIIESVASMMAGPEILIISNLDDMLIYESMRSLNDLAAAGIEPPYALLVSLIGVANAKFEFVTRDAPDYQKEFSISLDRDQYHFNEVIFETIPTTPEECASIIRPVLDQIANAVGRPTSPVFDNEGRYIPLRH